MVERPDAHIILPSWCASDNSLSRVTQHVNYSQVPNFDNIYVSEYIYSTPNKCLKIKTIFPSHVFFKVIIWCIILNIRLVGFGDISTSIGYLMPEPFYTYIIYIICKCKCLGWWWLCFMTNWPLKGHWVLNSNMYVCVYINVKAFCLYKLDGRKCW